MPQDLSPGPFELCTPPLSRWDIDFLQDFSLNWGIQKVLKPEGWGDRKLGGKPGWTVVAKEILLWALGWDHLRPVHLAPGPP